MRFLIRLFIFVFIISNNSFGNNSTFNFIRNDVSARAAAMGGSFMTVPNDVNTMFYNPSALATLKQTQVSLGFFKHLMDINSGHLSYAHHDRSFGYFGAGIIFTNYGDFVARNNFGDQTGNFSANELSLSGSYANFLFKNFQYGANVKFIYSSIEKYNSYGYALDFGLTYSFIPNKFVVGASLLNLGTQVKPYIETKEKMPLDFRIGASIKPEHLPLLLNISINRINADQKNILSRFRAFSVGGEFTITSNILLRFGYNNQQRKDMTIGKSGGLAGFSVGGGFAYNIYKIDYSFNSLGKIGGLHRMTIGIIL